MRTLSELMSLKGRVALVTGGAGHIGLACEESLAELGATVVVLDRDAGATEVRARDLAERFGIRVAAIAADLSAVDAASRAAIDRTLAEFGRLDILVNNAAYTGASDVPGWGVPFEEQTLDAWNAAIALNLSVPFRLAQLARAALASSGRGCIINVASIYGVVGPQWSLYEGTTMTNPAGYGATKGGLVQLTRYLATAMAPAVRVNCISPGGVSRNQADAFRTRYEARTPLARMGTEEDFKGAFAYLASDAAAYVTGHNLLVDGGWTAW